MNANLAAIAYIVSGVLFILALRGLSSPTTSQAGNRNGMIGMAIAVGTTLLTLWGQQALDTLTLGLIVGALLAVAARAPSGELTQNIIISKGAGALATAFASVNIFGGFLVVRRMLAMYKKKAPAVHKDAAK